MIKRQIQGALWGGVFLFGAMSFGSFALAQMYDDVDQSTEEGITAIPNAPAEDYGKLQKNLQQDRLTDAFKRIQALEQENRFQTRRIEKLERDVNDLRNNSSSRVSI